MPEYLSPGVYVEEIDAGPKPIEGVSTSTAGFVGRTIRGPVTGPPVLITSFPAFTRAFGGYLPDNGGTDHFLAHSVFGFFANGGKRVYIRRVVNDDNSTTVANSTGAPPVGGMVTRLAQNALSGQTVVTLASMRGIENGVTLTFTQLLDGVTTTEAVNPTVSSYDASNNQVTLSAALGNNYDRRFTSVDLGLGGASAVIIRAADPGAWGNDLSVQIFPEYGASAEVTSIPAVGATVQMTSTNGFYVGAVVEFDRGQDKVYGRVTAINGLSLDIAPAFAATTDLDPQGGLSATRCRVCEFRVVAAYDGAVEEFSGLSLNDTTTRYYATIINNASSLITVDDVADNATNGPFTQPVGSDGLNVILAGGADGNAPNPDDYVGQDSGPGNRSGIRSLVDIDQISIIAAPGVVDQSVVNELIFQCETLMDRFAIVDPDYTTNNALTNIQNQRGQYDTKYAALYFPNLVGFNPLTGGQIVLPPSGHMAGLYAKTDIERGVHKAPANVVVKSILDLDMIINKGEQDILNPQGINVVRDFRSDGRGIRVWGSRCMTSDSSWRYVPVRRLFIYVEESIDEGLQWVVFEPNDYALWARVRQSISNFLTRVWRDGALMGTKPEQAFFVLCDKDVTMTQDDIDNGRLIVKVGIAPVKPAEFVIIRIQQYTAEATNNN